MELPLSTGRPVLLIICDPNLGLSRLLLADLLSFAEKAQLLAVVTQKPDADLLDSFPGIRFAVPKERELYTRLKVETVPTTILFGRTGEEVFRYEGYGPETRRFLSSTLDSLF